MQAGGTSVPHPRPDRWQHPTTRRHDPDVSPCPEGGVHRWGPEAAMRFLRVDGHEMAYVEEGAGAPVLFVHGALADLRFWAPQMAAFARRYRAVAVSLR